MPDSNGTAEAPRTDLVWLDLVIAKRHLRTARLEAQKRQESTAALARITFALDAVQDALDYRSEQ